MTPKYTIVVVEDDSVCSSYYKDSIEKFIPSAEVHCFEGIDENFYRFVFSRHIDLFIIDIHLNNDNGLELSEKLLSKMRGLTFLFVSGYQFRNEVYEKVDGKCIFDYIEKPAKLDEFIIRVKALLNVSRSYNRVLKTLDRIQSECYQESTDSLRKEYFLRIEEDKKMIERMKKEMF